MKVLATKYATSSGVQILEGESDQTTPTMFAPKAWITSLHNSKHKKEWHTNKAEARADTVERFKAKRKSLEKALQKLTLKEMQALDAIDAAQLE